MGEICEDCFWGNHHSCIGDDECICDCNEFADDESMVDLGGGMVVPLRELMEDD